MAEILIKVDTTLNAAYIQLQSDATVARTVEHNDEILIDLDAMDLVVGIEVLDEGAALPFTDLLDKYHVHSDVVELLRLIRPDVSSFLQLTSGNDGHTSAHAADQLKAVV